VNKISRNKSFSKKLKLVSAKLKSRASPRWADLKKFGLGRARFRSIRRFKRRNWRRDRIKW